MTKSQELLYPKSLQEVWKWKMDVSKDISKSSKRTKLINDIHKTEEIAESLNLRIYSN